MKADIRVKVLRNEAPTGEIIMDEAKIRALKDYMAVNGYQFIYFALEPFEDFATNPGWNVLDYGIADKTDPTTESEKGLADKEVYKTALNLSQQIFKNNPILIEYHRRENKPVNNWLELRIVPEEDDAFYCCLNCVFNPSPWPEDTRKSFTFEVEKGKVTLFSS